MTSRTAGETGSERGCCRSAGRETVQADVPGRGQTPPRIQNLVPLALVIGAGCEPCARRMVERAWAEGSSWKDIRTTLEVISFMHHEDCLVKAVGPESVDRMSGPLETAKKTLARLAVCDPGSAPVPATRSME